MKKSLNNGNGYQSPVMTSISVNNTQLNLTSSNTVNSAYLLLNKQIGIFDVSQIMQLCGDTFSPMEPIPCSFIIAPLLFLFHVTLFSICNVYSIFSGTFFP